MSDFEVKIGPQEIYDKLVQIEQNSSTRYAEQAVTNAKVDLRVTALEAEKAHGWQVWLAALGFFSGVIGALIALIH